MSRGEVLARARATYRRQDPGSRAWASAGLPGAPWWITDGTDGGGSVDNVDLDEVEALYTENGLWSTAFDVNP
jgi:hypothetical protein